SSRRPTHPAQARRQQIAKKKEHFSSWRVRSAPVERDMLAAFTRRYVHIEGVVKRLPAGAEALAPSHWGVSRTDFAAWRVEALAVFGRIGGRASQGHTACLDHVRDFHAPAFERTVDFDRNVGKIDTLNLAQGREDIRHPASGLAGEDR